MLDQETIDFWSKEKSLFDAMPVIISAPGDYVTRDGRRVTIFKVDGRGTFSAAGGIWKEFRGRLAARGYSLWHANGRRNTFAPKGADIVGPWIG